MKHSQRPDKSKMVCPSCKNDDCQNCVDVLRIVYSTELICKCERKEHGGEAVSNQVRDPFDGGVYGPHSVIKEDGTVVSDEEFKQKWKEQFGD